MFDPASGLVSDIRLFAGVTAIKDHGFTFDLLGNLEDREDRLGARREDFIHDGLNRLTAATLTDTGTQATLAATTASYDALGNITAKSDVGAYTYDGVASGPHAVTRAGNVDYTYDLNGNMAASSFVDTSAAHRAFVWASFNKPTRMENSVTAAASEFTYGPSRARVKQTTLAGVVVTRTTTYIGADFERIAYAAASDELVHYIRAGGQRVVIYTKTDDGVPATDKTRYLHKDHLGSIDLVTDEAGLAAEARSFDAWGRPRNADWTPAANDPALTETPRGFTDHEHIQTVGLIHMNGRVQDPVLGRFISPDPSNALNPGVGFNRYAYAWNNPLSFTDPNGLASYGLAAEVQLATPVGGVNISVEVSVDTETGEIRGSLTAGERLGLRGKASLGGYVEPSYTQGNTLSGKTVGVVEAGAGIKVGPVAEIGVEAKVEIGAGSEGAILTNPDDILDFSANLGELSVNEDGRKSLTIGGGAGASIGYDFGVEGSLSISDIIDAVMDAIDAEDAKKDEPEKSEGPD